MKKLTSVILLLIIPLLALSAGLPEGAVKKIDSLMNVGLASGYYPGASIAVGNSNGILLRRDYGYADQDRSRAVSGADLYDVASLTKVVATTLAVMHMYDQNRIHLDAAVGDYITDYRDTPVEMVTIGELLTHTSGLPYIPAYKMLFSNATGDKLIHNRYDAQDFPYQVDRNAWLCSDVVGDPRFVSTIPVEGYRRAGEDLYINPAVDILVMEHIVGSYDPALRGKYRYSDTNFYILRQIIEHLSGMQLDQYLRPLYDKMGMYSTGFTPLEWSTPGKIIPTEYDRLMQRGMICGYVHDDLSAIRGGVEGNAGLYSTADDLALFCQMLLNYGSIRGERIIEKETVTLFTGSPLASNGIYRGYGFDIRKNGSQLGSGYGHTGYTGTMIWIDPDSDIYMVFLSNRVHPTRLNNGLINSSLRTKVWEAVNQRP